MTGPAVPSGLEALLAQATPGPWDASFEEGDEWWFGGRDGEGQAVIRPASGPEWESVCVMGGERKADARLIALAPDAVRLLIDMAASLDYGYFDRTTDTWRCAMCDAPAGHAEGCSHGEMLAWFAALDQRAGTA